MGYKYNKAKIPEEYSTDSGKNSQKINFHSQEISVPCQSGCPVSTNIPAYIEKISQGEYNKAYRINLEDNVFPGVLGRICVRPCQNECRHNWTDINGTVEICNLKRVAADNKSKFKPLEKYFDKTNKKVAIIGGGPSGLSAARELKRFGHSVTIYEKEKHLGGMLVDGIPRFRLPLNVINEEIKYILDMKINVKLNEFIDKKKLNKIIGEYDAILIAIGTTSSNTIKINGLMESSYYTGLDFMKMYNNKSLDKLSGDVVIIGGGFTAVDSARACARAARDVLGKDGNVTIVYRRTQKYMAADIQEINEMEKESIKILNLLSPVSANYNKLGLESITFEKNYLGDANIDGKPEIIPVEDGLVNIKCKHLILAIGQKQDYSIFPKKLEFYDGYLTNSKKIFTAGDFFSGSLDVIHSIADGKNVSKIIDEYLCGRKRIVDKLLIEEINNDGETGRLREHDVQDSSPMRNLDVLVRLKGDQEVGLGYNKKEAKIHSTRCYFCHYRFIINQDKCIHCNWCIDISPRNCIKRISKFDVNENGFIEKEYETKTDEEATFIWIDNKNCIRCGKCLRICPVEAISMKKTTIKNCKKL